MKRFAPGIVVAALLGVLCLVLPGSAVRASTHAPLSVTQFAACQGGSFFGFPPWHACLEHDSTGGPVIKSLDDIWKIAFPLVETLLKAAGYIAVGYIIWGGFKFIKAQGQPGEITSARSTILNAVIGLVLCLLSVAIVQFVANRF